MTAPPNSAAGSAMGKAIPRRGGVTNDISLRDCRPSFPLCPPPPHPHCLPTTLTFSSGAQAFLRAYPKDRGSTQGEGLLSDSLSSSE